MLKLGYKLMSEEHGPTDLVRNGNRHMNRRAPPSEMAGLSCF